jgi:drug/metabolite transporter (DMT)-like permease
MSKRKALYYLIAVLVMTIWSITYVSIKVLLNTLTPVEIMFYRFVVAYVVMVILHPKGFKPVSLREELLYIGAGISGGTMYFLTQNYALNYTSASNVGLLIAMAPVLTAIAAHFYTKNEKFKSSLLIGFAMAFAGSFLVIFNGRFEVQVHLLGDLLAIGSALCWAVYSIFIKKIDNTRNAILITRKIFFYSILTMLPALPLSGFTFNLAPFANPAVLLNLLFLALLASCACFLLWNKVIWELGAVQSSNFIYLSPLITLLSSAILLGEQITVYAACGGALILAGVYISENAGRLRSVILRSTAKKEG